MENTVEFHDLEVKGNLKVEGDLTVHGRVTIGEVKTEYTYRNTPLTQLSKKERIKVVLKSLVGKL